MSGKRTRTGETADRYVDRDGEVGELDATWFAQARMGRSPLPPGARKQRINLMLDPDVNERLRAEKGMSGRVNALLRLELGLETS